MLNPPGKGHLPAWQSAAWPVAAECAVGEARLVLIGDTTHGTHEQYHLRAELTKALIQQRGFNLVAVEADWPDAYRANGRLA